MALFGMVALWFEKKRNITVHCPQCGVNTPVMQAQCASCGAVVRSCWPLGMAAVLLAGAAFIHGLYLWKIVPPLAAGFVKCGMTFWLAVRIGIALSNFLVDYSFLLLPLAILGFIYLAFIWRPEKAWGLNLILLSAVIYAVYVMYMLFATHLMVIQELLPRLALKP